MEEVFSMDSVKFKLGKDFEVPNFEYFVSGSVDYLVWRERLYGLCGEDPQYCPPGKENCV